MSRAVIFFCFAVAAGCLVIMVGIIVGEVLGGILERLT
jgi:hypothetical protein